MPENTGMLQEGNKFKKGESGNPKGNPKGALNKSTVGFKRTFRSIFRYNIRN